MNHTSIMFALVLMIAAVSVYAETGFYVPKAFYTIDENGYKSPLVYVDSIPFSSAFDDPLNFLMEFPNPGQGGNFQAVSITSGGPAGLDNRFDEHGQSAPATTINTFSSQNGHVTHMTHHIDKDGKVTSQTNKNTNKKN
uniref:Uncharacterized protein n=1 Tax=Anopheles dirus TaxID=7168 RepID=A0A182NVB5_9DIPT